jgi:serine palmitoyltransferase
MDYLVDLTALTRLDRNGTVAHWYNHNIQPVAAAFASGNTEQIKTALYNAPAVYFEYIKGIFDESPWHVIVETILIGFIIYILMIRRSKTAAQRDSLKLTEKEETQLVDDWEPEPLVPPPSDEALETIKNGLVLTSRADTQVTLEGHDSPKVNLATFDFLGLGSRDELKDSARTALLKYGCGSCGPRGFYGTIDAHMHLEEKLASFFGLPEAIIYSDSANTPSSVIPAFGKRGDLFVVDAGCNNSISTGLLLSRAQVKYFKHNDMADLEKVLQGVADKDKSLGRKSNCQRRFIVAEGIFRNHGTVCNLPKLVELKKKYFHRLILDEAMSIGVLGKEGRGVTEHFGLPIESVDIISGSLANSFASVGGFCIGDQEVVDHQRLSGSGYVFSASAPPFVSVVAIKSLELLHEEPELLKTLQTNVKQMHSGIGGIKGLKVTSDDCSPTIHVRLDTADDDLENHESIIQELATHALNQNNGCVALPSRTMAQDKNSEWKPSLRVTVSAAHTKAQIKDSIAAITKAAKAVL